MKYILAFIIVLLIIHILSKIYNKFIINDNKKVTEYTYYINLEKRKDRKKETIQELKNFGIDNPIRFNADSTGLGYPGIGRSHLAILKESRSKNYPYVMIVEDDIEFMNPDETNRKLNNIINSDLKWDVILLSCGYHSDLNKKINKDSVNVNGCTQTTGYIVKKEYYDTLINHWEEGLKKLIETDEGQYVCDQYWHFLQQKDNFLLINPVKVYQRNSYSDLIGGVIDYKSISVKYY